MGKNQELANIFSNIALYIEMEEPARRAGGGVSFRSRAYEKAAGVLESLGKDVSAFSNKEKIPGIGESLGKKIEEYLATGKIKTYENLKKKIPVNIEELTSVEGLGPKMVQELYKELNIKNLKELEKAAKAGKIQKLENFGEKTQQNILQGIEFAKRSAGRWLLGDFCPYQPRRPLSCE